jgi:ubiquinone/menaquinone biosynthesis C-methylase UbiE
LLALAVSVGDAGRVTEIDISCGMFKVASKKIARANLSQNIMLEQGDVASLPYDDYSFEAIFISFTLELIDTPEIAVVLSECQRVLKSGGRICVVEMARDVRETIPSVFTNGFISTRLPMWIAARSIFNPH